MTTTSDRSSFLGMVSMISGGLGFAVMVAFVKAAAVTVPVPEIVCVRSSITALAVTIIMIRRRVPFLGYNRPLLLLRGLLGSIAIGLAFYAASVIPLVDLSIIAKTSVIFTALFAAFWLKEKPPEKLYFYTGLGFLGIALVIKPTGQFLALGGFAALTAAIMIGLIGAMIRKLQETDNSLTIVFVYTWMATIGYAAIFGSSFVWLSTQEGLYLVGAGVAGTVGQLFFTTAYKYAPASEVTPFLYSETLFAASLGAFYFGEIPDKLTLAGACLAVYAGIAIARSSARAKRNAALTLQNKIVPPER